MKKLERPFVVYDASLFSSNVNRTGAMVFADDWLLTDVLDNTFDSTDELLMDDIYYSLDLDIIMLSNTLRSKVLYLNLYGV